MGALNFALVLLMSERMEAEALQFRAEGNDGADEVLLDSMKANGSGRESLEDADLGDTAESSNPEAKSVSTTNELESEDEQKSGLLSRVSPQTRSVMFKLWPLLAVDSIADGMVGPALTTYYLQTKFQASTSTLGDILSIGSFLAAASTIFAGPLANHLGLVNTMVFTHVPSSAAVLFFPLPQGLAMTIVLFMTRTGLNNMDQAPRSAFIAAAVKPTERTAVLGITSTLRTLASVIGPSLTGGLAESNRFWLAYVLAGSFRLAYDFGLWALFINMKLEGVK